MISAYDLSETDWKKGANDSTDWFENTTAKIEISVAQPKQEMAVITC